MRGSDGFSLAIETEPERARLPDVLSQVYVLPNPYFEMWLSDTSASALDGSKRISLRDPDGFRIVAIPSDGQQPEARVRFLGFEYCTAHVNETATFFERHFGFTQAASSSSSLEIVGPDRRWLLLKHSDDKERLPDWFHFGFRVSNPSIVRRYRDYLLTQDVEVFDEFVDSPDYVSMGAKDPSGNNVEVYWDDEE